ncbi:MAG TPA: tRNA uridine-5-carboxymethylaminomethyl(34) synthesis GTPase MnmE [Victivallales bacterium]|nr:tRNA uridine-5-carboxymethylaminomethyl(34) synthesis GTPase MnmE [Victivallales bacterium]
MNENDTITAICSGVGGAITVIRISGASALEIGNKIWKSSTVLSSSNCRKFLLGKILPDIKGIGETAFAVFTPAPKTFTGENIVEIHAHGGNYNAKRLLTEIIDAGARQASPGEFTYRAFVNGKLDLTQAEAVSDLITANSNMAIHLAERQMDGVLGRKIIELRNDIVEILVDCEARLDFPEEELDFMPVSKVLNTLSCIKSEINKLYKTRVEGSILRDGIRVVIAGKPNVGKSSLLNLLLGFDRAITTEIPGTTRDTLEEFTNIRGIPVRLIDTAGLRESDNVIEEIGINRTMTSMKRSQVILWVLDASADDIEMEANEMHEHLKHYQNVIAIWNKMDLAKENSKYPKIKLPNVSISVKNQKGIEEFLDIFEKSVWERPHVEEPEIAVSQRHAEFLLETYNLIPDILNNINNENWELAAASLKSAAIALGNIIGEDATLDIYETIFSKFCIGK